MKPPSNLISPQRMAKWLGWCLMALIIYAMVSAVILFTSLVLLQKGIIPDLPWVSVVQAHLYSKWSRNIWQTQPDCVVFDPEVIYKPKHGACHFDNVEFRTVLNFSADGRYTGDKPAGNGIAVLGDSHAMGWGVGDEETFSAELQRLSGRPVFNLAVSSYGTVRELMRLEKSGLLDKVDTIIIQYCDNDLEENVGFRSPSPQDTQTKFATITQARAASLSSEIKLLNKGYWFTFRTPFSSLSKRLFPKQSKSFLPHYQPVIDAISQHEALKSKRIIIFYSNVHGGKFRAFPAGKDRQLPNIEFVDLSLERNDYYRIDGHLTTAGHRKAGQHLFELIRP